MMIWLINDINDFRFMRTMYLYRPSAFAIAFLSLTQKRDQDNGNNQPTYLNEEWWQVCHQVWTSVLIPKTKHEQTCYLWIHNKDDSKSTFSSPDKLNGYQPYRTTYTDNLGLLCCLQKMRSIVVVSKKNRKVQTHYSIIQKLKVEDIPPFLILSLKTVRRDKLIVKLLFRRGNHRPIMWDKEERECRS